MTDTLDRKTIFHCIRTSLYAVRVALNKEREDLKVRDVWLAAVPMNSLNFLMKSEMGLVIQTCSGGAHAGTICMI